MVRKFPGGVRNASKLASSIQGQLVQGVQQFAHAVDNKLIQNDQRNDTQAGAIKELYTTVQNLVGEIGKNQKDNILTHQKFTSVEQNWKVLVM